MEEPLVARGGYRTDGRTQRGEPVLSFHCVRCPIMTHSVASCVRHNARVKAPRRNATRKSKHYTKVFLRTSSHVNPEYKIERELSRPADTAAANLRQSRDFRRREGKKIASLTRAVRRVREARGSLRDYRYFSQDRIYICGLVKAFIYPSIFLLISIAYI